MKKISFLLGLFILLSAFTCDNEPLEGDFTESNNDTACDDATDDTAAASAAFNNATDANYTDICNAYKDALEAQIAACGDDSAALQLIIDGLGDCSNDGNGDDCDLAINATNVAETEFNNATIETYTSLCNAYVLALENQILQCGDPEGSLQATIDVLGNCMNDTGSGDCNGLSMVEVTGQPVDCTYNMYDDLQINNIYIDEAYATDANNDGNDDHFLTFLYVTDGTANLDADDNFVSFQNDRTYMLEIALQTIGTTGFEIGDYIPFIMVDLATDSYLSTAVSSFGAGNCDPQFYTCQDSLTTLNGVVSITGTPGNYEICFDFLLDFDENCFKGSYTGDFTVMHTD